MEELKNQIAALETRVAELEKIVEQLKEQLNWDEEDGTITIDAGTYHQND